MKKKPGRKRKPKNLTLSEVAIEKGEVLASVRGIKLTQLVEQLLRQEFVKVGLLPPESK